MVLMKSTTVCKTCLCFTNDCCFHQHHLPHTNKHIEKTLNIPLLLCGRHKCGVALNGKLGNFDSSLRKTGPFFRRRFCLPNYGLHMHAYWTDCVDDAVASHSSGGGLWSQSWRKEGRPSWRAQDIDENYAGGIVGGGWILDHWMTRLGNVCCYWAHFRSKS